MPQNEPHKDQTYLRQLLGGNDYQLPDHADLAHYLAGLRSVYHEFEYLPRDNPQLDEYFRAHRGAHRDPIDLTSSATSLPPYEPAVRAASEAAKTLDEQLHGRYNEIAGEMTRLRDRGAHLTTISVSLSQLRPRDMDQVDTEKMLQLLANVLVTARPEEIQAARKGLALPNEIEDCIRNCSDRDYYPKLPRDRSAIRTLNQVAADFTARLCDYQINGLHEPGFPEHEGLRARFMRLHAELEQEHKRLPGERELRTQSEAMQERSLKPAVIELMKNLQGIDPKDIKPQNIALANGSSTHVTETALSALVPKPGRFFGGGPKKLIMFAMAWDGLKTFTGPSRMDVSLVPGPVNAQALEEHIQKYILKGENNPPQARAEVKKQVGALLLNIPENPLGKIPSDKEMAALAAVVEKYDIPLVVVDEIFAAPGHRSLLTYPGMKDRAYIVSSTSKNINTNIKMAYGYSDNDSHARAVKGALKEQARFHPAESAAFSALLEETPLSYYSGNQEQYARKRRLMGETMERVNKELGLEKGLHWVEEPNYGCLGVIGLPTGLTDAAGIHNSCELAEYIYKTSGVKGMPTGDVTPSSRHPMGIRVNFSEDDHMLIEGIERMGVAIKHMQRKVEFEDIEGHNYRGRHERESAGDMLGTIADMLSRALRRGLQ